MKTFYKTLGLVFIFFSVSYQVKSQAFDYALKFNYGVFNYNDESSESIKKPFDTPFSLGLQFQSNLSKAFTNSIGVNTYKWANNSSYSIQDLLFLRNNARLLNRLKPQIGFGLGFEEVKTTLAGNSSYQQLLFIPVNVGIQIDLSERIALGVFGEFRYGFDVDDIAINKGSILPNNTAGFSLAYRFSKTKEKAVYPETNWSANPADLITIQGLKSYQDAKTQKVDTVKRVDFKVINTESVKTGDIKSTKDTSIAVTKMQVLKPILVSDSVMVLSDSTSNIKLVNKSVLNVVNDSVSLSKAVDSVSLNKVALNKSVDSISLAKPMDSVKKVLVVKKPISKDSLAQAPVSNGFSLNDFTDNTKTDTVYITNQTKTVLVPATVNYPVGQQNQPYNYNSTTPTVASAPYTAPNQGVNYTYQATPAPLQITATSPAAATTGLQIAETASSVTLNAQLAKLIEMQSQTLALLNQTVANKSNIAPVAITSVTAIDSLKSRINDLESRLNEMQNISKVDTASNTSLDNSFCIITYAVNKTDLNDAQRNLIISNVFKSYLKSSNKSISIESYTDSSGPADYNKKVSDLRLKNAVRFLLVLGVKPTDVVSKSYGESKSSESINPEERRLVIKIIDKQK